MLKNAPVWVTPFGTAMTIAILEPGSPWGAYELIITWVGLAASIMINVPTHIWYMSHIARGNRGVELKLRAALVRRLQHLSIAFHTETESGRIQAKVLRDVEQVEQFGNQFMQMGIQSLTMIAVTMIATLVMDPLLAIFYVVTTPLSIWVVSIFKKKLRQYNRDYRVTVETMNARVGEMITMIPVTRAHGIEDHAISEIQEPLSSVRREGFRLDIMNAMFQSSAWATLQFTQLLSLVVTGTMCYLDMMEISSVVLYQMLYAQMIMGVNMLLGLYPQLAKGMESMRSLGEVLECPDLEHNIGKESMTEVAGEIRFRKVGFTYRNRADHALKDLSFSVKPGQCVPLLVNRDPVNPPP